jgi:hypothetical protein
VTPPPGTGEASSDVEENAESGGQKRRTLAPRAAAPEQSLDLQAMRALANQTARSAIDTSARRKWAKRIRGKWAICAAAATCGGVTATLAFFDGLFSWNSLAAAASFATAIAFALKGLSMRRQPH